MFKKMRNKLLITNLLIILAMVIACLAAIQITTTSYIERDISQRLEREINIFRDDMTRHENGFGPMAEQRDNADKPPERWDADDDRRPPEEENRFNSEIAVYCDKDANVIRSRMMFEVGEFEYNDELEDIIKSEKPKGSVMLDDESWAYLREEYGEGYIVAFTKNEAEKNIILRLNIILGISALFSMALSFIISLISANRSIRPIEDSYEKQKQFVADASHELRTPLASIRANTDVLLSKRDSTIGEEYKWLEYIKDEAERMTALTNDLLTLARSDSEESETVYPEISFTDTVREVLIENEAVAFENGVTLESTIAEGIKIIVPPEGLKQLVLILIDNALKYTPKGGRIDVTLARDGGRVIFRVSNDGEISAEDLPHIFERFYRADKSRARESGGYGLGLAIAESLTRSMGGRIAAESENGRTMFTVTF
ncbi:MAG: HAMP domain-containing histidine kinase [Clostridia bacterium]|nr:HAMP domain-containing histidine kinase [Clostridia bacterium]